MVPPGKALIVCDGQTPSGYRTNRAPTHPIKRVNFHSEHGPFRGRARYGALPFYIGYGLWQVLRFRPKVLFTIYFNDLWILSSLVLSKLTRIPVVYYIIDPYLESASYAGGFQGWLAQRLEPVSLRHGHVLVFNQKLRQHYAKEYGIEPPVARQINRSHRRTVSHVSTPPPNGPAVIGFVGSIYDNNESLLRQLAQVGAQDTRIHLRLWTNATPSQLHKLGLTGDRVTVKFEPDYERLVEDLSACHLLYLPLAFGDTPTIPSSAVSCFVPTKVIDYLLSGPPILLHCPAGYEIARLLGDHGAAYELNSDRPKALANWISAWIEGKYEPIPEQAMRSVLEEFSAQRNGSVIEGFLREVSSLSR